MPRDEESKAFATLMEWNNLLYKKVTKHPQQKKSTVRVGLIQWQMRSFKTFESICEQI